MNKKIAVIISVYSKDNPLWFRQSLDSILHQTYNDLHIYVGVDGQVGDDMEEVFASYSSLDKIDFVRFHQNRGLTCVLNDLLDICFKDGYEFIARMDADDISLPDRFEKQMAYLESHPEIDVVGGFTSRINSKGELLNRIIKLPESPDECKKIFAKRTPLAHPAVLFRITFFEKIGHTYRSEYRTNQDTVLWYDGLMNGAKIANVQDVVLYFRVSDDLVGSRRGGYAMAKKQLDTRLMINKGLGYGVSAYIYAIGVFLYMITPVKLRAAIYKRMR